jgi:hypothetical protein
MEFERRREEDESEAKGRVGCRLEFGVDVVDGTMPTLHAERKECEGGRRRGERGNARLLSGGDRYLLMPQARSAQCAAW